MTNKEKIININKWQSAGFVHELTCGSDNRHTPLIPIEEDGEVILMCPDCDYKQYNIPYVVLNSADKISVTAEEFIKAAMGETKNKN